MLIVYVGLVCQSVLTSIIANGKEEMNIIKSSTRNSCQSILKEIKVRGENITQAEDLCRLNTIKALSRSKAGVRVEQSRHSICKIAKPSS